MSYFQRELIGVNRFVSPTAPYGAGASEIIRLNDIIDPLFLKESDDEYLPVEPLLIGALSYDWEALQVASDRHLQKNNQRPKVAIIKGGGPVVQKKMAWLSQVLSLGGVVYDTFLAEDFSALPSRSRLVLVVPSGDDMEENLIVTLRAKGPEKIWSLSHAKEDTGIDRYLDTDANALAFVKDVHRQVIE